MIDENFFPELKHFRIKTTDKRKRRKLSDLLAEKSITAEDLKIILKCLELKPNPTRETVELPVKKSVSD